MAISDPERNITPAYPATTTIITTSTVGIDMNDHMKEFVIGVGSNLVEKAVKTVPLQAADHFLDWRPGKLIRQVLEGR